MNVETELSVDFDLPKANGDLIDHDYAEISPAEAFRLFEELNRERGEADQKARCVPCTEPFVLE